MIYWMFTTNCYFTNPKIVSTCKNYACQVIEKKMKL